MRHVLTSIIIVNKNERMVEKTLAALAPYAARTNVEVIVVDASKGKLDHIYAAFPWLAKYDFVGEHSSRKSTIPEQRNFAVNRSNGDIIAFIDAGGIPQSDWLEQITTPVLEDGESMVAGLYSSLHGKTHHDSGARSRLSRKYIKETGTGNLAFRREVFARIGGFDKTFDYGSDVDFCWRARAAGYRIRSQPSAVIAYDWGSRKDEMRRSFKYGRARMYLFIKHKSKRKEILTHNIGMFVYPLYAILLPVSFLWPWYPALIAIPLLRNIHNKPLAALTDHFLYGFGAVSELYRRRKLLMGSHE